MGGICEIATSAPGYTSVLPKNKAPLAMTLKLNGYSTAQFGKCHEVPVWETSPMGPFDQWPTGGGGFEYFYGFIGGETNQWYPAIYEGTTPIEPEKTPEEGYHFTEDMTNKAIKWTRQQKALMPDKPFFMYFAPGASHAPHHVPKEWADKYKGKFDQGWDKLREEIFARQKKLGVIPADAELTARPAEIPAWDETPEDMRPDLRPRDGGLRRLPRACRPPLGRLIDALADLEVLDDTLIYYIIGDNGASAEGTLNGCFNEMADAERHGRTRDAGVPDVEDRRVRRARSLQPLRGRLGARDGHALPVDQAGRVALGRHAQRHDRALAERHQGQGRGPQPVPPRHRRRADGPRSGRTAASGDRQQHPAGADRGRQHALRVQRRQGGRAARDAVLRDVLQPRHLPQGLDGGDAARRAVARRLQARASTRTCGSSTTPTRTGRRRTIWRRRTRRSWPSCSGCS